jgi:hypothetical protein
MQAARWRTTQVKESSIGWVCWHMSIIISGILEAEVGGSDQTQTESKRPYLKNN